MFLDTVFQIDPALLLLLGLLVLLFFAVLRTFGSEIRNDKRW